MITLDLSILNQKGTPMFYSDVLSARPNFGIVGRIFIQTDAPAGIWRDTGTSWEEIATNSAYTGGVFAYDKIYGGYDKSIAYWQSTPAGDYTFDINADGNFVYDYTIGRVGIGTSTPSSRLDIHGTDNSLLQLNNTTTDNSKLTFLNQNVQKWNIGNVHGSGQNYFQLYDIASSSERLHVLNTGEFSFTGWQLTSNTITGITGTSPSALPNSSISNNFTFNSGISTSASVNTIGLDIDNNLTYSGTNTINSTSYNVSGLYRNILTFGSASTIINYNQSAGGIRTLANVQNIYIQQGSNSGTISHYANYQIFGDQKLGSGTTTFTNRYQLLLNDYDDFVAGFTYTNRWAIYQVGASNTNYFNGKIITGSSTTIGTYQLDVTGTSQFTGNVTYNTGNITGISSHTIINTLAGGTTNVNAILGINYLNTTTGASASTTYGIYNYQLLDVTGGSANSNIYAQYNVASIRGLATTSLLSGFGTFIGINRTDSSDISTNANNSITALSVQASHGSTTGSATIVTSNMYGNNIQMTTNAGTISNAYGTRIVNSIGTNNNSLANTITNLYGFRVNLSIGSTIYGASLVTNYYGLYIDTPTINATGTLTNRWGLYAPDSAMNHSIVGSVAIGSGSITTSAQMSVVSTTKGFLPPVMTTTQKNAISTPTAGLIVFDTTLAKLCVYSGSAWQTITSV
jgi:hypothetical protein